MSLPPRHATALETFLHAAPAVEWVLTGSASFAIRGIDVEPDDLDVQTDAAGARRIVEVVPGRVLDPVEPVEGERMRSVLGRLELAGVEVEVFGDLRTRRPDGRWREPVDVTEHREFVEWRGWRVPVLSLAYEADAYERLGRDERAATLRAHLGSGNG